MWKFSSLLIDTICLLLHLYRELQNMLYTYPYNKNQQDADCTDISRFTVNKTLKKNIYTLQRVTSEYLNCSSLEKNKCKVKLQRYN